MYSSDWFQTFAATVAPATIETELDGISAVLPRDAYPRIVDVGCGIGRIAGPLSVRGYAVTGLDSNLDALRTASTRAPGPAYIALDQRHVGRMRWAFDGALVLWNSLGFVDRACDVETVSGLAAVLRPDGKVIFDLYHPEWLRKNERAGGPDRGAVSVRRWMRGSRCCHEIRYASGRVDDIQFEVYQPEEMRTLARRAGLAPLVDMVAWDAALRPSPDVPRYQLVCVRPQSQFNPSE